MGYHIIMLTQDKAEQRIYWETLDDLIRWLKELDPTERFVFLLF